MKQASSKQNMKQASSKQKMNIDHENAQARSFNIGGQVRSSAELVRKFQIKQEKVMMSNVGGTKEAMARGFEKATKVTNQQPSTRQILPSTTATSKPRGFDKKIEGSSQQPSKIQIHPTPATSKTKGYERQIKGSNQQPSNRLIPPNQSKGSRQVLESNSQCMDRNQMRMEEGKAQSKGCLQIQEPKRNPTKRVVAEANELMENYQSSRQPLKKGMIEHNDSHEKQRSPRKKIKRIPMCPAMLIDEFLEENGVGSEGEEEENEMDDEEEVAGEEEGENVLEKEGAGTSKKRTRGPTRCLQIHARPVEERQEVTLDENGEPIGPTDQVVSDLSYFLGTLARNGNFCPLIYTSFKALTIDERERIWKFVNEKFIIPDAGRKAVLARINDAWRRYKNFIKRNHYLKYSNLAERLKNRPKSIPETHFRKLMSYWRSDVVQNISKKNALNRAKQKYRHRMGPTNFARIRAKLRAKKENGEDISQAEMFIETRQSRKGKKVDQDTQVALTKLQESVQDSSESAGKTFQSLFGEEKPGRVRCLGRTVTPTMLKRNEEIAAINKQHSHEMNQMTKKMQGLEGLVRCLMKQVNPNLDDEALNNIMENALSNESSAAPRSSTSTHNPNYEKQNLVDEEDEPQDIGEE